MVKLKELEQYLTGKLDTTSFDDYCVNGIQIEGKDTINGIVTGVSASVRLFEAAVERNVDAVIVHHGLFWKNSPHPLALKGPMRKRVKLLLDADISLLGYHLPLDAHSELGNSALISKALGLIDITFTPIAGMDRPIAAVGNLAQPLPFEQFLNHADRVLATSGLSMDFSNGEVSRVFVLSGGGSGYYSDASASGAEIMVTGELKEDMVRYAEELGLSLYAAGHYNSEKWGIKALGEHLREKFDIEVEFVDVPNPV